jgi:hypothetical protein
MLAGEAVVAIWNGIAPESRADFYDWHQNEHMPERVGIPGPGRARSQPSSAIRRAVWPACWKASAPVRAA